MNIITPINSITPETIENEFINNNLKDTGRTIPFTNGYSNNTATKLLVERYYNRYNKQLQKEQTLKIVKGILTAIAFMVMFACLFLMTKVK